MAEPSQAQPSRRVTQAAAEPGDSPIQGISAERPLCQPGVHKWHRTGDTEGLPPAPSPADALALSPPRHANILPTIWCVQPD